ncbi:MAG: AAA family ATPase [Gammaproteobacteria bacterium]|nr:AAA family ATPase [Gammaproteobacteria bacterium]
MKKTTKPTSSRTVSAVRAGISSKSTHQNIIIHRQASEIEMKKINWLWPDRIARGKITMLSGNPGLGKSQLIAYITGVITNSGTFADKTECIGGNVIILSAEDDAADTIVPRLKAANANLTKVSIIESVQKNNKQDQQFNLSTDISALEKFLLTYGDVAAIFIDPISAYLGDIDDHKNGQVRSVLSPLSKLAEKYQVAIICISHHNKSGSPEALLRVLGSIGFVAAARAAFAVMKDPDDENRRYFLPLKNNIGNDKTGLVFYIEPVLVDDAIETSRIQWVDGAITKTADEILRLQANPPKKTARDEAKEMMKELLSTGSKNSADVISMIQDAGYSLRTIERVKADLGVISKKIGFEEGWLWHLPKNPSNEHEDRQDSH